MIIKNVTLETVCGITSPLPENELHGGGLRRKIQRGKIFPDQRPDEPESPGADHRSQPGKTQTINFYNVNSEVYLVDLPGYGYAKVSQSEKEKWGKLIENYLHKSPMLKAVFLLIDIRHEPSANDKIMYDWIVSNGFDPIIIATKLDKIKRSQIQKQLKLVRTGLGVKPGTVIIPFSAETKQGRDEIWAYIEGLMKEPEKVSEEE